MVGNRRVRFVIVLDSCCISIGLVFIKDRPVSSFWVLRFRSRVLRFRDLGVFVFEFWVLRFRDRVLRFRCRVLRFRVLGASFSRFGCFVLRSSFSSASFSKLPEELPVQEIKHLMRHGKVKANHPRMHYAHFWTKTVNNCGLCAIHASLKHRT